MRQPPPSERFANRAKHAAGHVRRPSATERYESVELRCPSSCAITARSPGSASAPVWIIIASPKTAALSCQSSSTNQIAGTRTLGSFAWISLIASSTSWRSCSAGARPPLEVRHTCPAPTG